VLKVPNTVYCPENFGRQLEIRKIYEDVKKYSYVNRKLAIRFQLCTGIWQMDEQI